MAHELRHAENAFSVKVEEELNVRCPVVVHWTRSACYGSTLRAARNREVSSEEMPFAIWALLADANPHKRSIDRMLDCIRETRPGAGIEGLLLEEQPEARQV